VDDPDPWPTFAILAPNPRTTLEAKRMAIAVRRSAATWRHIRKQLRLRITDLTFANVKAGLPKTRSWHRPMRSTARKR